MTVRTAAPDDAPVVARTATGRADAVPHRCYAADVWPPGRAFQPT